MELGALRNRLGRAEQELARLPSVDTQVAELVRLNDDR
jgi:hypothetical protein